MVEDLLNELSGSPSLPWPGPAGAFARSLGPVGFDREMDGKAAGLRTHMLVGLAAAVYCVVTLELIANADAYDDHVRTDPIRIVEAVTQGVAFLAVGLVVFKRGRVRGLTTGAGMWLSAAVGLACGLGLWLLALLTTGLALVVIRLLKICAAAFEAPNSGDAKRLDES